MAGPFQARFRAVVEPLFGRPFAAQDGYSEEEIDSAQSRAGYALPEALQDFYAVAGRFDPVLHSHNRFYSPSTFSRMDDKRVFCEENQVVVYWGYDQDQGWRTDPPVYQGPNNDEIDWHVEADRCSDFLVGMIYWQALWGGLPHFRSGNADESVREAAATWPQVWKDDDSQLFSRGSLVFSITRKDRGVEVQASALLENDLEDLWHALGLAAAHGSRKSKRRMR
jgi:hypothetical protein